jgi:ribosomal protein S18 acetylase RimI-like enzyme
LQELENAAPGTGYVYILSTSREMRSRGVGTRLLSFAERYRGSNGMSLIVADNNARAKSLYERCGYAEVARRSMVKEDWQSLGADWILMVKP